MYFALIDCNNFYASCERVFNPKLRGQPVIVLSNNDGCIIARSQEAKDLGFVMGEPLFKCLSKVKQYKVHLYSSNFALYGDMSHRVMSTLRDCWPDVEVYSIDEAFLRLKGLSLEQLMDLGVMLRQKVYRDTGLPISIGVGRTKTLAKVANRIAKKNKKGVCVIDEKNESTILREFPIDDVWGIGRRHAQWLRSHGVLTAHDFAARPDAWIKKKMTVVGLRTAMELRGVSCFYLEDDTTDRKAIRVSRSFGYPVTCLDELREAISTYNARACTKLRRQQSLCSYISVFIETNRFRDGGQYYANTASHVLVPPTAYTPVLNKVALQLLQSIYREGGRYKRAGVLLSHFTTASSGQTFLWGRPYPGSKQHRLMQSVDQINKKLGREGIFFASEGFGKPWYMNQAQKSPRYTTHITECLRV